MHPKHTPQGSYKLCNSKFSARSEQNKSCGLIQTKNSGLDLLTAERTQETAERTQEKEKCSKHQVGFISFEILLLTMYQWVFSRTQRFSRWPPSGRRSAKKSLFLMRKLFTAGRRRQTLLIIFKIAGRYFFFGFAQVNQVQFENSFLQRGALGSTARFY